MAVPASQRYGHLPGFFGLNLSIFNNAQLIAIEAAMFTRFIALDALGKQNFILYACNSPNNASLEYFIQKEDANG